MKKILVRIAILAVIVGALVAVYSFTPLKEWLNPARLFESTFEVLPILPGVG